VFVTYHFRVLAGGTALVAGVWFLSAASAAPPLPKATYKKLVEADVAQLQKHLDHVNDPANSADVRRYAPTIRSMAMMLAMEGEATGDKDLRDQALEIAKAALKKDYKTAGDIAKKLAPKPGAAPLKPTELHKMHDYALDEVMSPFRSGRVGGLNMDLDMKGPNKKVNPDKLDVAAVELLAARTAVLGDYMTHFPNDKAQVNKANTDQWVKMSKDTQDISKQLAEEAAKGKGANEENVRKLLKNLENKCFDCHNKFRDD
jgi:hypothetical protein